MDAEPNRLPVFGQDEGAGPRNRELSSTRTRAPADWAGPDEQCCAEPSKQAAPGARA